MATQCKPATMPWLTPYLMVQDADRALDFYARAFGFAKKETFPGPDGKTMHAEMTYKDAMVMFGPEGTGGNPTKCPATLGIPSPVGLYVYVEDVDALCKRAEAAGAKVQKPPADMFYGDRSCTLLDPDGHAWTFATHTGRTFEFSPGK